MRVVLGLVARADNGSTPESRRTAVGSAVRRADRFIEYAFPSRLDDLAFNVWRSGDGAVALLTWHNEASIDPDFVHGQRENGAISLDGYSSEALSLDGVLDTEDFLGLSGTLGGCFGLYRAGNGGVEAVTDTTRSNGIYYAESPSLRIISSRALLSHLIQQGECQDTDDPSLRMNLVGIRHMAWAGYFLANQTPYVGVEALDSAESIRVDPWLSRRVRMPASCDPRELGPRDMASIVQDMAATLVAAFDSIAGRDVELALTGGRDSRLIAAALTNRPDIRVTATTMGMEDDPDVVIARMLSRIMGVEHRVAAPDGVVDRTLIRAEEPLSRIVRALDVHDAMTSGWDDIMDYGPMRGTPELSGVGGEILRGGIVLIGRETLEPGVAAEHVTDELTGGSYFTETYDESARALAQPLVQLAADDPYRALDDYYFVHRNGRWISARRSGTRFRTPAVDPMLDNRFVRLVRAIPAEIRWKERLMFDLLTALAPQMRDLPIEAIRWRFERSAPDPGASDDERAGWQHRESMVRSSGTMAYSWKRLSNASLLSRMRDLILDGLSGPAGSLMDRKSVEAYLDGCRDPLVCRPEPVWHMATAVVMLSLPWYKTLRLPRTHPIEVRLANG